MLSTRFDGVPPCMICARLLLMVVKVDFIAKNGWIAGKDSCPTEHTRTSKHSETPFDTPSEAFNNGRSCALLPPDVHVCACFSS